MRIAAVAYTHYLTDPRVRREAEALVERGDTVEVFSLSRSSQAKMEEISGVIVWRLPMYRYRGSSQFQYILSYIWFTLLAAWYLTLGTIKNKYDLVHVHNMPDFVVFSALFPKLLGAKVVLDIHDIMSITFATRFKGNQGGIYAQLLVWEQKISAVFADHIITVHEPYKELLVKQGIAADKISVIMNVPDDSIFPSTNGEPTRPSTNNSFLLVHHGTIVHRHGLDIALRAVAKLKDKIPGLVFRIIGEGDFLPEIKRLIQELEVGDMVELTDHFIPVHELPPFLQEADVAIVPNRLTSSTAYILPLKLMEYIQLGLPVIVARTPTVEQYFNSKMVRFFEAGNFEELAESIEELFLKPNIRGELVTGSVEFTQKHNWQVEKQTLYAIVDSLVKGI